MPLYLPVQCTPCTIIALYVPVYCTHCTTSELYSPVYCTHRTTNELYVPVYCIPCTTSKLFIAPAVQLSSQFIAPPVLLASYRPQFLTPLDANTIPNIHIMPHNGYSVLFILHQLHNSKPPSLLPLQDCLSTPSD